MADLLDQVLLCHTLTEDNDPSFSALPIRDLVTLFLDACEGRNLQPATIEFYRCNLNFLVAAAGDRLPSSLTTQQLKLLIQYYRRVRQWSIGTTNHAVTTWKVFFHYLKDEHVVVVSPMDDINKLKGSQYLPEPYSDDEIRRMLIAANEGALGLRNRAMLYVLLDTGIRLSELLGLRLENVFLHQQLLRVFGKGRKERTVAFCDEVRQALEAYMVIRSQIALTDAFWVNPKGESLSKNSFTAMLHQIALVAGVEKAHVHRFRHTFATVYLRNGGHAQHLQRLLGHTTPTMTQRYTHLTDADACADHGKASPVAHLFHGNR
ncbi:MAG: tyrosine-type recombinase/integrase [Armatimonadota bacterium]